MSFYIPVIYIYSGSYVFLHSCDIYLLRIINSRLFLPCNVICLRCIYPVTCVVLFKHSSTLII